MPLLKIKNEIKLNPKKCKSNYCIKIQSVRTNKTNSTHKRKISTKRKNQNGNVGCGDGRYSLELLKSFDDSFYINCVL